MRFRRRAYLLNEIVGLIPLIALVVTISAFVFGTSFRAQRRTTELALGYDTLSSLLDTIRQDARSASRGTLQPTDGETWVFELNTNQGSIRYNVTGDEVTRDIIGSTTRRDTHRTWPIGRCRLRVDVAVIPAGGGPEIVTADQPTPIQLLTIYTRWKGNRQSADSPHHFQATIAIGRGYEP
jgi:hypothetical protein